VPNKGGFPYSISYTLSSVRHYIAFVSNIPRTRLPQAHPQREKTYRLYRQSLRKGYHTVSTYNLRSRFQIYRKMERCPTVQNCFVYRLFLPCEYAHYLWRGHYIRIGCLLICFPNVPNAKFQVYQTEEKHLCIPRFYPASHNENNGLLDNGFISLMECLRALIIRCCSAIGGTGINSRENSSNLRLSTVVTDFTSSLSM